MALGSDVYPRFWCLTHGAIWMLLSALSTACSTPFAQADNDSQWIATWTASPQSLQAAATRVNLGIPKSLSDQTLRQVVHVSLGGRSVRVELSNVYGSAPLIVGEARIARTDRGSAIIKDSDKPLKFGGETRVSIAPGAPALSDPVELDVSALSDLTVSLYLPEPTQIDTFHWMGRQTGYLASGNVTAAADLTATATFTPRAFLSAVLVAGSAAASTVVAFGDSITDGALASLDGNQRWPDVLAQRLAPYRVGAVNAGISGNQLLQEVSALGNNAVARFERDALSQPGVKAVIVLIGINDIGNGGSEGLDLPTPDALIAGYRQLIAQAHCRGIRIFGATLTPYEDALKGIVDSYYTPEKALIWSSVNDWIRSSGEFDGVVDFDKALRDPEQPTHMLRAYDSGDRLHPNDAGDRALAEAVDLSSLLHKR